MWLLKTNIYCHSNVCSYIQKKCSYWIINSLVIYWSFSSSFIIFLWTIYLQVICICATHISNLRSILYTLLVYQKISLVVFKTWTLWWNDEMALQLRVKLCELQVSWRVIPLAKNYFQYFSKWACHMVMFSLPVVGGLL